jgi:hypothetical protein
MRSNWMIARSGRSSGGIRGGRRPSSGHFHDSSLVQHFLRGFGKGSTEIGGRRLVVVVTVDNSTFRTPLLAGRHDKFILGTRRHIEGTMDVVPDGFVLLRTRRASSIVVVVVVVVVVFVIQNIFVVDGAAAPSHTVVLGGIVGFLVHVHGERLQTSLQ